MLFPSIQPRRNEPSCDAVQTSIEVLGEENPVNSHDYPVLSHGFPIIHEFIAYIYALLNIVNVQTLLNIVNVQRVQRAYADCYSDLHNK